MKKTGLLLCSIFFLAIANAQSNKTIAESFVKALAAGNYQEATSYFDPSLKQVNKEVLEAGWKQMNTMFGAYQSYYVPATAAENSTPVTVGIRFEKSTQGFACNFNDQHKMVGFLLAAAPKDPDAPASALTKSNFPEEAVSVKVNGGTLKGTLLSPANKTDLTPVALIVAGSGPTDRDGNSPFTQNNAYRLLAEALAAKGIASLRYDKRMVAASNDFTTGEADLSFDDYVKDVTGMAQFLQQSKGYRHIYIVGHSEGSLLGILAAQSLHIDGLVSIAGAGENIADVLQRQLNNPEADKMIGQLRKGHKVNDVPASLQSVFRPSVQPFIISWMKYDPAREIAKVKVPVLILQGTTDLQVTTRDAENLKKGAPAATLRIIPGMNHILKDAPEEKTANMATYMQPELPLDPSLAENIVSFFLAK